MEPDAVSRRLVAWALETGFDRAATARLRPSRESEAFLEWLAAGDHAGMGYLERRVEARLDPRRLFDGARGVLCVARQYAPVAGEEEPVGDLWPGVARYARGDDYHDFMVEGLRRVAARVEEAFPGVGHRWYVDTGPVLERELAAQAGLGVVGKNTCLLDPEAGSWFLVGELFVGLELADGEPLADLCGSCTLCLEACPTGALPEPYRLDSNRCISYWTIEHRGTIPRAMRQGLGEWVFGCDVCQEVCPVNAAPALAAGERFRLPRRRAELDLAALLGLDREQYVERFRRSPMKRAKLPGLRRNAAVAMGNRRDPRYVEALAAALSDEDPVVRGHAAWALGEIGGAAARRALERALDGERDPEAQAEMAAALDAARGSEASPE